MKTVTINFLSSAEQDRYGTHQVQSRHRADDEVTAIDRAVQKLYGKGAWFLGDNGLHTYGHYGQVYRSVDGRSATALSARVRIDISSK